MPTPGTRNQNDLFTAIAREHLRIATLETRNHDRLDFHEVAVWSVRAALQAAYDAGRATRPKPPAPPARKTSKSTRPRP